MLENKEPGIEFEAPQKIIREDEQRKASEQPRQTEDDGSGVMDLIEDAADFLADGADALADFFSWNNSPKTPPASAAPETPAGEAPLAEIVSPTVSVETEEAITVIVPEAAAGEIPAAPVADVPEAGSSLGSGDALDSVSQAGEALGGTAEAIGEAGSAIAEAGEAVAGAGDVLGGVGEVLGGIGDILGGL